MFGENIILDLLQNNLTPSCPFKSSLCFFNQGRGATLAENKHKLHPSWHLYAQHILKKKVLRFLQRFSPSYDDTIMRIQSKLYHLVGDLVAFHVSRGDHEVS